MSGTLRKTMEYLGIAQGAEYEDELTEPESEVEDYAAPVTPLHVAPETELSRIVTIHPTTYNEAREIGEEFRSGVPVIMNLTGMSEAEAKRMVDFSAGLVFGLHGVIERVTNRVFLLSPQTVKVSADKTAAPRTQFFNQG